MKQHNKTTLELIPMFFIMVFVSLFIKDFHVFVPVIEYGSFRFIDLGKYSINFYLITTLLFGLSLFQNVSIISFSYQKVIIIGLIIPLFVAAAYKIIDYNQIKAYPQYILKMNMKMILLLEVLMMVLIMQRVVYFYTN